MCVKCLANIYAGWMLSPPKGRKYFHVSELRDSVSHSTVRDVINQPRKITEAIPKHAENRVPATPFLGLGCIQGLIVLYAVSVLRNPYAN